jgi:hypothetical protein
VSIQGRQTSFKLEYCNALKDQNMRGSVLTTSSDGKLVQMLQAQHFINLERSILGSCVILKI